MKNIPSQSVIIFCLILVFTYLLILQPSAAFQMTIDDMYISLRYARNWANGDGLLWNIHEAPVEGYSNSLFVIIGYLAIKAALNPIITLKIVGWIGLGLSALGVYCISSLFFRPLLAVLPCIGLLLYQGEILWSISGLETTVYQALILFALYMLLRGIGYQPLLVKRCSISNSYLIASGLLFFIAALTRPEAPFLLILFFGIALFDKPSSNESAYYRPLMIMPLVFGLLYVPYFIWRLYYFGRLFPNPIYCKGNATLFKFVIDKDYLKLAWPFIVLSALTFWKSPDKRSYYLFSPSCLYLILLVNASALVSFDNRLFLPAFSCLLILAFMGLMRWVTWYMPKNNQAVVAISCFLIAFFFIPSRTLRGYYDFTIPPQKGEILRNEVIDWLNKHASPNDYVVLGDSGQIPYLTTYNFVDSYCLNNKAMTESNADVMDKQFCETILSKKHPIVILASLHNKKDVGMLEPDRCLSKIIDKNPAYKAAAELRAAGEDVYYQYKIYTLKQDPNE